MSSLLIEQIGAAIMQWQDATGAFDDLVGDMMGLSASERRAIAFLMPGPASAKELARAAHLSPPATTALIDRLERLRLVKREPATDDRRKITVVLTKKAMDLGSAYYGPLALEGAQILSTFSDAELAVVVRFLEGALSLQRRHLNTLRLKAAKAKTT
jgi:DNA-binding MarR family transcriptional regulator